MAISLTNEVPASQVDTSDPFGYPYGKYQNVTSDGANDGTPAIAAQFNDFYGHLCAILDEADLTPSNVPDKVNASQYLTASKIVHGLSLDTAEKLLLQDPTQLPVGTSAIVTSDGLKNGIWVVSTWTSEVDNDDTIKVNTAWSTVSKYWQKQMDSGPNPGIVNGDAALRVGAEDPLTQRHIAIGPDSIVSKYDATTIAPLYLGYSTTSLLTLSQTVNNLSVGAETIWQVIDLGVSGGGRTFYAKSFYSGLQSPVFTKADITSQYTPDDGGSRVISSEDENKFIKITDVLDSSADIEITVNTGIFNPNFQQQVEFWYPGTESGTLKFIEGTNVTIHRNVDVDPNSVVVLKKLVASGGNEEFILVGVK